MATIKQIKDEVIVFLRNSDILSTTVRGVTTTSDTGTFSSDTEYLIDKTNVKNIRTVTVNSVNLAFGDNYTVDYNFNDSGTIKCKILFNTAVSGAYTITYDYGSDKIYPDFPRDDLSIDSYPRIAVDVLSGTSDSFGIGGNVFISSYLMTCIVYSDSLDNIDEYSNNIKTAMINNAKNFYYFQYIKPSAVGPAIEDPERSTEIMQRNIDFEILFDVQEAV